MVTYRILYAAAIKARLRLYADAEGAAAVFYVWSPELVSVQITVHSNCGVREHDPLTHALSNLVATLFEDQSRPGRCVAPISHVSPLSLSHVPPLPLSHVLPLSLSFLTSTSLSCPTSTSLSCVAPISFKTSLVQERVLFAQTRQRGVSICTFVPIKKVN